jgi:hypothetical protein
MKAIVRNILLACVISMFALFGAVARKHTKDKMTEVQKVEARKETCTWRCIVLNKRLNEEREYQRRFNEYMRNSAFHRQH